MTRIFLPWDSVLVVEQDVETFSIDATSGMYFEYKRPDGVVVKVSSTNYTVTDDGNLTLMSATVSLDGTSGLRDTLFDISWKKFLDSAEKFKEQNDKREW